MNYSKKNGLIIFTGIVLLKVLSRLCYFVLKPIPLLFLTIPSLIILVCYVGYSLWWVKREKDFTKIYKTNIAILSGAIALDLITFGWQKYFHFQFNVPFPELLQQER